MRPVSFAALLVATLVIGYWLMRLDADRLADSSNRPDEMRMSHRPDASQADSVAEAVNLVGEPITIGSIGSGKHRPELKTAESANSSRQRLSSRPAPSPFNGNQPVPAPVEHGDEFDTSRSGSTKGSMSSVTLEPFPANPKTAKENGEAAAPLTAKVVELLPAGKTSNAVTASPKETTAKKAVISDPNSTVDELLGAWTVSYQSTEGRPIHTRKMGTGEEKLLILAGIEGNDRVAVKWVDAIAGYLEDQPELLNRMQFLLVRAVNPDGLTRKSLENSHNVELNRNFPARNWAAANNRKGGSQPASEVETRAVLSILKSFEPTRVMVLRSSPRDSVVIQGRQAGSWVAQLPESLRRQARKLDRDRSAGSVETYIDDQLGLPLVSVILPVGEDWKQSWPLQQAHILSVANGRSLSLSPHTAKKDWAPFGTLDDSLQQVKAAEAASATTKVRRRGYEELPPPPKNR